MTPGTAKAEEDPIDVVRIRDGLWRWTIPHPAWTEAQGGPTGWAREVGCLYLETPSAIVLVDPLVPPEGTPDEERFWRALDRDVERAGRPVEVLLTCRWHGRSADAVAGRYATAPGSCVRAHDAMRGLVAAEVHATFGAGDQPVGGITAHGVDGGEPGEVALWIPRHAALVFGDAVLGARGGGVRLCPPDWLGGPDEGPGRHARLRGAVRRLAELPVSTLLPSHGAPVLEGGGDALIAACEAAA